MKVVGVMVVRDGAVPNRHGQIVGDQDAGQGVRINPEGPGLPDEARTHGPAPRPLQGVDRFGQTGSPRQTTSSCPTRWFSSRDQAKSRSDNRFKKTTFSGAPSP